MMGRGNDMGDFIAFITDILEEEQGTLNLETKREDCEKWDSLMHLRIVMEIERKYGVEIPFEIIPNIRTLNDLYQYVK